MKNFTTLMLICSMIMSMAGCTGDTSSSGSSSDSSQSSSDSVSTPESTPDSSSESTPEESTPEESKPDEIEEVPYELGGELTPTMIANSRYNEGNKARLAGFFKKLKAGEEVTVAYLGGSITQGVSAGNDLCYARLTTNWLEEQFPDAKINYVNAGIGATGSYIGVHRADKDVISHNPDLVFVEFSVNDTTERTEINKSTYESLLRKLWLSDSSPALVTIAMTQEDGTSFQEYHGEIIKKYDLPMISYKNTILDVIDKGYIKWAEISDDNIHPNIPGHAILSGLVTSYLQDVIDSIDEITDTESDFSSVSAEGEKYQNAHFVFSTDTEPANLGAFKVKPGGFGGFNDPWIVKNSKGEFTEDDAIEFEVTAKNIGILYGKLTSNGCLADIYVDGELAKTIDNDFSGGWGNYAEFDEIITFETEGTHTIKIVPRSVTGKASAFYLCGLALS